MGIKVNDPLWDSIENEYMTLGTPLREIARKYKLPTSTVNDHAIRGKWYEKRKAIQEKGTTKLADKLSEYAPAEEKAQLILDGILTKIAVTVDLVKPGDTRAFKELTSTMKELKELGVYKGEAQNDNIEVAFEQEAEDYAD